MTNEEAKIFLDNLKVCIEEHPIVADWLVEIADRKTENSSEKPNNCEPQTDCGDFADRLAYERGVKHAWEVAQKVFNSTVTFYEAEDVAKQIDKDINVRSKDEPQTDWETEKRDNSLCYKCVKECDRRVLNRYTIECNQYEPKDEPQTDCAWR